MAITAPHPKKWTRKEYYAMAELGLLDGQYVELIEGEIVEMSPQNALHASLTERFAQLLQRHFGKGYIVRRHSPLSLSSNSDPEPDIAVVEGGLDDFLTGHPTTAALVVEIALSSLVHDRERKGPVYARAGIKDYWIANLREDVLEVYREPKKTARGFIYTSKTLFERDEMVAPLESSKTKIAVKDLFPPAKA